MSGWQPIETAPKDGTVIDVWLAWPHRPSDQEQGRRMVNVLFEGGAWVEDDDGERLEWGPDSYGQTAVVTHWQPLPEPPQ